MKHMNVVVSVIIIAAVLVTAYAVGLLVRHARMHDRQSGLVTNEDFKAKVAQQLPGERYPRGTDANMAAQIRQQREQKLEEMKHMTKEEKHRLTEEEVRKRFSAAAKGQTGELSPAEREKMRQQVRPEDANQAPATRTGEPQNPGQTPGQGDAEPNKAGKG